MKALILLLSLVVSTNVTAFAQNDSIQFEHQLQEIERKLQDESVQAENRFNILNEKIRLNQQQQIQSQTGLQDLKNSNFVLQESISVLSKRNESFSTRVEALTDLIKENNNALLNLEQQLSEKNAELNSQILETRETTSRSVSELDEALNRNTLYWIITVFAVALLTLLAFVFLRKKVMENQSSIIERLADTRKELEHESMRLDERLIGVMDKQLKIIEEERKVQSNIQTGEQDHSLALKVADEIIRIEKNIGQMDNDTRGLKQLSKAVERIKDNFASNGYEMVNMLGKPYDDGMKVEVNFIPDEKLDQNEAIIKRIIKPQILYNGKMIQTGHVEVSQGLK